MLHFGTGNTAHLAKRRGSVRQGCNCLSCHVCHKWIPELHVATQSACCRHKEELRRADEAERRAHEAEADAARKAAFDAAMHREQERVEVILTKQARGGAGLYICQHFQDHTYQHLTCEPGQNV